MRRLRQRRRRSNCGWRATTGELADRIQVPQVKCFVTGATGFLGSHVARQLLAAGADLRLLVRPTSRLDNIAELNCEQVVGDLRDVDSLSKGMADCEFVFHVAADYRLWARDGQELYQSNVDGTRNILQAARDSGVRRV